MAGLAYKSAARRLALTSRFSPEVDIRRSDRSSVAMLRIVLFTLVWLAGCAHPSTFDYSSTPFAIGSVQADISEAEVRSAVEREVAAAPVCIPIPPAWWDAPLTARFGPQSWRGREIPEDVEDRLNGLVAMGFWTREELEPLEGDRRVRFRPTDLGEQSLRGNLAYANASFCAPAERRLVRIISSTLSPARPSSELSTGFRHDSVGFLIVRFEWIGVETRSWLPSGELRERYASLLPDHSNVSTGSLWLYRIWRRDEHPLLDAPDSGSLEPFCYDNIHNRPEECGPRFD